MPSLASDTAQATAESRTQDSHSLSVPLTGCWIGKQKKKQKKRNLKSSKKFKSICTETVNSVMFCGDDKT